MSTPTMGVEDLRRLIHEMVRNEQPSPENLEDWCEGEHIDEEMMDFFVARMATAVVESKSAGYNPTAAFLMTIAACFQIGWEAHKQYGNEHREF